MQRFKNIVLQIGPHLQDEAALERAATLASNNQARLTVVDVAEDLASHTGMRLHGLAPDRIQAQLVEERLRVLEERIAPLRKRIEVEAKVLVGIPFLEVIREVLRHGRDLVIKVAEGPASFLGRLFGSDHMHLLRKCPCPVWLIKAAEPQPYHRILAAVDVHDADHLHMETRRALNRQILELAASLSLSEFAEMHVVHVWSAYGEDALRSGFAEIPKDRADAYVNAEATRHRLLLNQLMNEFIGAMDPKTAEFLHPTTHLLKGWAQEVIPELAARLDVDLIVMGTVARTGIPGFIMGNTAEEILNRIDCSVLATKPPGFVTPVTLGDEAPAPGR